MTWATGPILLAVRTGAALAANEHALVPSHRTVFDALAERFCVIEKVFDDCGVAVAYHFVEF